MYNERISRLSLEAKQARHRADAAMRKLRELVQACKTQDLNTISTLAVQVDTDSIASPYSEKPQWEQQVRAAIPFSSHVLIETAISTIDRTVLVAVSQVSAPSVRKRSDVIAFMCR